MAWMMSEIKDHAAQAQNAAHVACNRSPTVMINRMMLRRETINLNQLSNGRQIKGLIPNLDLKPSSMARPAT